ncbi:hypothetical protein [Herminiimonas fonticola]|uniref:hypothetical protein n=1 Tax=Herminiimonas fonticola TaxID=303380 RepID=UPI0013C2BAC9|nr:hypothetical protein [Herminiimonas fonticola]
MGLKSKGMRRSVRVIAGSAGIDIIIVCRSPLLALARRHIAERGNHSSPPRRSC